MVLSDIPLQSKKYTWSNMQQPPLLEKLDWVFTNNCCTLTYPETICKAFVMRSLITVPWLFPSHLLFPRLIFSDLKIIGCSGMTFKRFYLKTGMLQLITEKAKILSRKYKNLRGALKTWSSNFSNLKISISNISLTLQLIDSIEEFRDLSLEEWNFRTILRDKLLSLLEQQRVY